MVACEALLAVWQLPKSGGSVCSDLFSGAVTNLAVSAATHTAATDAVHSQQNHMLNVGCSTVRMYVCTVGQCALGGLRCCLGKRRVVIILGCIGPERAAWLAFWVVSAGAKCSPAAHIHAHVVGGNRGELRQCCS